MRIPFNKPFTTGRELEFIQQAIANSHLSGDGFFTRQCHAWLEQWAGAGKALLTHSCTGALELAALLAGVGPGDEVIMPSFTFASTANAFVLRGAVPVFVDIDELTLNIDVRELRRAITPNTRAVVPVHYGGIGCDMDEIMAIAAEDRLLVIEDAAQGLLGYYRGRPLGGIGHLGALSFHETKNVMCGEGGALLVNERSFAERAEILREKGTNRSRFFRGEIGRYTWIDVGSSYLPSELTAAFLWAQCQQAEAITKRRLEVWLRYHDAFVDLERAGLVRRPVVPDDRQGNAHLYYLILNDRPPRDRILADLNARGVNAVFHYVPLHSSSAGRRFGRVAGELPITERIAAQLIRLPLWVGMGKDEIHHVVSTVQHVLAA